MVQIIFLATVFLFAPASVLAAPIPSMNSVPSIILLNSTTNFSGRLLQVRTSKSSTSPKQADSIAQEVKSRSAITITSNVSSPNTINNTVK